MAPGDMRDLVRQNGRHLRLVRRLAQHAAVDPDGAAWERERVDLRQIGNGERVGIFRSWRRASEPLSDIAERNASPWNP